MIKEKRALFFLHGFLGAPNDWCPIIELLSSSYLCIALTYPFKIPKNGILIGYSMGGRIALRYNLPKILISTHLGLKTVEENRRRREWEHQWIQLLETSSFEEFIHSWYSQPLFDSLIINSCFSEIYKRRLQACPKQVLKMLKEESLTYKFSQFVDSAQFIYGQWDTKFKGLYLDNNIEALEVKEAGHACHLENPVQCCQIIKQALDRLMRLS